jgi:hypothetical protein
MAIREVKVATWARTWKKGLRPHGGVADTYEYVSQEADHDKKPSRCVQPKDGLPLSKRLRGWLVDLPGSESGG